MKHRRLGNVEFYGALPDERFYKAIEGYLERIKPSEERPLAVILLDREGFRKYIKDDLSRLNFWRTLEAVKLRVDDEARKKIEALQERYVDEFASHIHGCFRPGRSGDKSQIAINIAVDNIEDTFFEELLHYEAYRRGYFQAEFGAADKAKELFVRTHIDRTFIEKIRQYIGDLSASCIAVEKGFSGYVLSIRQKKLDRMCRNVKADNAGKYRDPLASFEIAIDLAFAITVPSNFEEKEKIEKGFDESKSLVLTELNETVRERFEEMLAEIRRIEIPPGEQRLLNCYTTIMSIYHSLPTG